MHIQCRRIAPSKIFINFIVFNGCQQETLTIQEPDYSGDQGGFVLRCLGNQ